MNVPQLADAIGALDAAGVGVGVGVGVHFSIGVGVGATFFSSGFGSSTLLPLPPTAPARAARA